MMKENTFTLNTFDYAPVSVEKVSPAVMLVCGLSYALAVSLSYSTRALIIASIVPAIILLREKIFLRELVKINAVNLIMIITLGLTWPEFWDGIFTGLIIAWRVNAIYIFFAGIIFPMGISGIYGGLYSLGLPEKLRVLIILTLRGIFIMHERFSAALVCVKLRAPNLKGIAKLKIFAYIVGSVLLQSASRSEKMMFAVKTRGGFGGFSQAEREKFSARDVITCVMCACYVMSILLGGHA